MKTPMWAYITGIFMIFFGIYEAYSGLQVIENLRRLDMIGNISGINFIENLNLSDIDIAWANRFAYIGLLVWFIFMVGGIFLLIKKTYSIKLAYVAIISSILFFVAQCVVFIPSKPVLLGLLIVLVLLIVLLASDKSPFYSEEEFQE